jgi:phosphate-transporting ATPase
MLTVSNLSRVGLAPASFTLAAGECVAVRGPSGAGKTLLLRAIADLDPNQGQVVLDGRPREAMSGPEWRRRVGYLPAEPGWWADTVGEHFPDWPAALPLVSRLGLPDEARDWPLTRPSTGERLRLALVRALMVDPSVLLLDEPTAALDAAAVAAVESLMGERLADGLAVLWVTHDEPQAGRVAGRRLLVEAGQVREGDPP